MPKTFDPMPAAALPDNARIAASPKISMPFPIRHLAERGRFEASVEGQPCVVDYELAGAVMTITHTEVPPALRRRGIAGELVQAALDHAQGHGLRVHPACWYARDYMRRHPETMALHA